MAKNKAAKSNATSSSNDNKKLLIYVAALGALLLVLVYVLVYQRLQTEAETIDDSNRVLAQRVDELKVYYDKREDYLADTLTLEQLIDEILMEYPADAREEDAIMLAVQMQHNSGAEFVAVNMTRGENVYTVPLETVTAAANEKYAEGLQFNGMSASYTNEVSYAGLKSLIQTVFDSENRIKIQNIAYSKGDAENPRLSGHVDLVFYSVDGTGKEYVAPDMVPYIAGTDNIFGEIVIPAGNADNNNETVAEGEEGTGTAAE